MIAASVWDFNFCVAARHGRINCLRAQPFRVTRHSSTSTTLFRMRSTRRAVSVSSLVDPEYPDRIVHASRGSQGAPCGVLENGTHLLEGDSGKPFDEL